MSKTPAPVITAVFPDVLRVGKYQLRPLSMAHFLLLEKLDSPLVRTSDATEENIRPPEPLDIARALFVATRKPEELQAYYEGFDRKAFEAEVWQFIGTVPAGELASLGPKLTAVFNGATSTMTGGGLPEAEGDGKKKRNREP